MTHPSTDPVDHDRTTRQHAGEAMKNGVNAVGIAAVGIGVVTLMIGLFAFATGNSGVGTVGVVIAVLLAAAGLGWLRRAHNRVRAAELQWHDAHSDRAAPPPTS
ncbi:MAG: hypothetical protein K2X97_21030 [Mycobacteriaceae bacterium]|nr:hypothetical protein [Mycobacteriaceae bacterium]